MYALKTISAEELNPSQKKEIIQFKKVNYPDSHSKEERVGHFSGFEVFDETTIFILCENVRKEIVGLVELSPEISEEFFVMVMTWFMISESLRGKTVQIENKNEKLSVILHNTAKLYISENTPQEKTSTISISVHKENARAISFYQKNGYVFQEERDGKIMMYLDF